MLDTFKEGEVLLGGDLNCIDNPPLDRTFPQHQQEALAAHPMGLAILLYNCGLIGVL